MHKALGTAGQMKLRSQFSDKSALQFGLRDEHEKTGAYGLAYLALWAVLETFAKQLFFAHEREKLQADLLKWVEYMNGASVVRPSDIGTLKFKPNTFLNDPIPPKKQLTPLIAASQAPTFYLVLDPEEKYRRRRNLVAHSGEVVSAKVYEEFKEQAEKAIQEIVAWLGDDIG